MNIKSILFSFISLITSTASFAQGEQLVAHGKIPEFVELLKVTDGYQVRLNSLNRLKPDAIGVAVGAIQSGPGLYNIDIHFPESACRVVDETFSCYMPGVVPAVIDRNEFPLLSPEVTVEKVVITGVDGTSTSYRLTLIFDAPSGFGGIETVNDLF